MRLLTAAFALINLRCAFGETGLSFTNGPNFLERAAVRSLQTTPKSSVAIIGAAGNVGKAVLSNMVTSGVEVRLQAYDVNEAEANRTVVDLRTAACDTKTEVELITVANSTAAGRADVIVIVAAAGAIPSGKTAVTANAILMQNIIEQIKPQQTSTILVVTNPVDTLTLIVQKLSGLNSTRVLGSGTLIDQMRQQELVKRLVPTATTCSQVDLVSVGQQGVNRTIALQAATINGERFDQVAGAPSYAQLQAAANVSVQGFGVAEAVKRIVVALLNTESSTKLPVTVFDTGSGIYLSELAYVGNGEAKDPELPALTLDERVAFLKSVDAIRQNNKAAEEAVPAGPPVPPASNLPAQPLPTYPAQAPAQGPQYNYSQPPAQSQY